MAGKMSKIKIYVVKGAKTDGKSKQYMALSVILCKKGLKLPLKNLNQSSHTNTHFTYLLCSKIVPDSILLYDVKLYTNVYVALYCLDI